MSLLMIDRTVREGRRGAFVGCWLFVVGVGAAACGGAAPHPEAAEEQSTAPASATTEPSSVPASSGMSSAGSDKSSRGAAPSPAPPAPATLAGPSLVPSAMGDRLKGLGLDPLALPAIGDLTPQQRFKVMDLFTESLGVPCGECHEGKNYKVETDHKKIARFMWDSMMRPHKLQEGPVFCDSCHQGSDHPLNRSHPDGVAPYMKAEFSGRLMRTSDAGSVDCATCHGDDFQPDILDNLP